MPALALLAVALSALAPALPAPEDGLAPLGAGIAGEGPRVDVVLRAQEPTAGRPATLRLLASDALTDAPVVVPRVLLRAFGPLGTKDLAATATPGLWPGHYLARVEFPREGSYAFAFVLPVAAAPELLAASGLAVAGSGAPAQGRPWPWLLSGALLVALFLLFGSRRPCGSSRAPSSSRSPSSSGRGVTGATALLGLFCLSAGDARAHGAFTPPPAAIPGAKAYLSQEIQFALGLRTEPAKVESFAPPPGAGGAPRRSLGVSLDALVERDGHKLIFVRTAPERFVAREPKLGWRSAGRVAVLSDLVLGEPVVTLGAGYLRNGGARP